MAVNKRAEQRRQAAILDRISLKYDRRIAYEIARAMREASRAYSSGQIMPVQSVMGKHQSNIERILTGLWKDSIDVFSERIARLAKHSNSFQVKMAYDVLDTDIANTIMSDWLRSIGLQKITQITSTTKNDIENIISDGIDEGLGEKEIGKLINSVSPTKSASRSQTISRTESHSAADYSANETAKATGLELNKEWVSAENERTRDSHIEANGQVVGMYEAFTVGGFKMMMPSDDSMGAPASEIINCRCAVVYTPVD
jgi:uncharacterized protein with gpF-like domain